MATGSMPAAASCAIQPCSVARATTATGVRPFGQASAERETQLIDILGELFLERERHGPGEFHAAARRQLRLGQQDLRGGGEHHDARGARHGGGQAQGTALARRARPPRVLDAEPLGILFAGCGKAQQQCVRHVF